MGLEDNIYFDNLIRSQLATNYQLLERVIYIAKNFGREIATPREVREMLGLKRAEEYNDTHN